MATSSSSSNPTEVSLNPIQSMEILRGNIVDKDLLQKVASRESKSDVPTTIPLDAPEPKEEAEPAKDRSIAIVNAANEDLSRGSGVCGAIFAAAEGKTDQLTEACQNILGQPKSAGQAVITPGFRLEAQGVKHIIHAVGPRWTQYPPSEKTIKLLSESYRNSLELAKQNGIQTVIFPTISSGLFISKGFSEVERNGLRKIAVETAVNASLEFLRENPDVKLDVKFICLESKEDDDLFEAYKENLAKTKPQDSKGESQRDPSRFSAVVKNLEALAGSGSAEDGPTQGNQPPGKGLMMHSRVKPPEPLKTLATEEGGPTAQLAIPPQKQKPGVKTPITLQKFEALMHPSVPLPAALTPPPKSGIKYTLSAIAEEKKGEVQFKKVTVSREKTEVKLDEGPIKKAKEEAKKTLDAELHTATQKVNNSKSDLDKKEENYKKEYKYYEDTKRPGQPAKKMVSKAKSIQYLHLLNQIQDNITSFLQVGPDEDIEKKLKRDPDSTRSDRIFWNKINTDSVEKFPELITALKLNDLKYKQKLIEQFKNILGEDIDITQVPLIVLRKMVKQKIADFKVGSPVTIEVPAIPAYEGVPPDELPVKLAELSYKMNQQLYPHLAQLQKLETLKQQLPATTVDLKAEPYANQMAVLEAKAAEIDAASKEMTDPKKIGSLDEVKAYLDPTPPKGKNLLDLKKKTEAYAALVKAFEDSLKPAPTSKLEVTALAEITYIPTTPTEGFVQLVFNTKTPTVEEVNGVLDKLKGLSGEAEIFGCGFKEGEKIAAQLFVKCIENDITPKFDAETHTYLKSDPTITQKLHDEISKLMAQKMPGITQNNVDQLIKAALLETTLHPKT